MPIRQRLTSHEARFSRKPEVLRAYLEKFSKENPALVSHEMYDAITKVAGMQDLLEKVKIQPRIVLGEEGK